MGNDRTKLPLRQNCEGYFLDSEGNILALPTDRGYVIFPGGGIEPDEDPRSALIRETHEETGAIVKILKPLGHVSYEWPSGWAKTEKQKRRYEQFRGDEMHFYTGTITGFTDTIMNEEDAWHGDKLVPLTDIIDFIEKLQPFPAELNIYYSTQLGFLKSLLHK
jgi:8-oxo-dGTP pyrophosphatase MutT (NUDIX family)